MKLYEILNENVEDEQSAAMFDFAVALEVAKRTNTLSDAEITNQEKQFEKLLDSFSKGYESDNDNLMYGSLDDMQDMTNQIAKKVGEEKFEKIKWEIRDDDDLVDSLMDKF